MKHTPAMFALLRLHAELGGKIKENKSEAKRLAKCMKHVEAVLRMLEPGYDVRPIAVRRRKPNPWFKRGTIFRTALGVLRTAGKPLTARDIALAMLALRKVANAAPRAVSDLAGTVQSSLHNHKGGAVKVAGQGSPAHWTIA